jgi:hypothetical protein
MTDAEAPAQDIGTADDEKKAAPASGPGATYVTPMHPNGVKDTSMDFEGPGGMKFNPCVTGLSIVIIWAFCIWCMVHTPCGTMDFAGTCSIADFSKEECMGLASATVTWQVEAPAACSNTDHVDEAACTGACTDCETYYPDSDGSSVVCECPCPYWTELAPAVCKATGDLNDLIADYTGSVTVGDLNDLIADYTEAQCVELGTTHPPVWTDDADAGSEIALRKDGVTLTAAVTDAATDESACTAAGGDWHETAARTAGTETGQLEITLVDGKCRHYKKGCPAASTGYGTEDALAESPDQDWSANQEFARWKSWVASRFNWFYIGSQDVWIVFIAIIYFSKYSSIKLCRPGEEDQEPEYSDASWFTMLFCSGIGVGLFYFGVAEPV